MLTIGMLAKFGGGQVFASYFDLKFKNVNNYKWIGLVTNKL
jgi:chromate transport protein ChrA